MTVNNPFKLFSEKIVIAASNSSAHDKRAADYVCDGTADQVEIQAAIASLGDALGGTIHLCAGLYTISSTILLKRYVQFEGDGTGSYSGGNYLGGTVIALANTSNCDMMWYNASSTSPSFIKLRNFTLYGNRTNQTRGHGLSLLASYVSGVPMDVNIDRVWAFYCKEDGFHIGDRTYPHPVVAFDDTAHTITLTGNFADVFKSAGKVIVASATTSGNNGEKTLTADGTYSAGTNLTTLTISDALTTEAGAALTKVYAKRVSPVSAGGAWGIIMLECLSETNSGHGLWTHGSQCYVNGGFYAYNVGTAISQLFFANPCVEIILRGINTRTYSGDTTLGDLVKFEYMTRGIISSNMIHLASNVNNLTGLWVSGNQIAISGNVIRDSSPAATGTSGIQLNFATSCAVNGNMISNFVTGIKEENGATDIEVSNIAQGNCIDARTASFVGTVQGMPFNKLQGSAAPTAVNGMPAGADQAAAGAIVGQLWKDTDDNAVKVGV